MSPVQLILYLLGIVGYYVYPQANIKMIPALILAVTNPIFYWAAIGDYFLAEPGFTQRLFQNDDQAGRDPWIDDLNLGIISFTFLMTGLLQTRSNRFKWAFLTWPGLILGGFFQQTTLLIIHYTLILSLSLGWHLRPIYEESSEDLSNPRTNRYISTIGIILYIISDLLVLGDLLDLTSQPSMGLPIYWTSLILIKLSQ